MDKVKLHSPSRSIIPKHILSSQFNVINHNTNVSRSNTRTTYESRNGVIVDIDGFGTYLRVNPTRFLAGTNVHQITRIQLQEFFDELEEQIKVDTDQFKLTGFDFNQNVYTAYGVPRYIPIFRGLQKYSKSISSQMNGVTFSNRCKAFIVYDKKAEMTKKGLPIPLELESQNVLRMELCVNSKIHQTQALKSICKLRQLAEPEIYVSIVRLWEDTYRKIEKQSIYNIDNLAKPLAMPIDDFTLVHYIYAQTMEGYFNQIDDEGKAGKLTRSQVRHRKSKASRVWNAYINELQHGSWNLLHELDNLVGEAAQRCLGYV